jgi:hypothetical protein
LKPRARIEREVAEGDPHVHDRVRHCPVHPFKSFQTLRGDLTIMERIHRVRLMAGVSLIGVASVLACETPVRPEPLPSTAPQILEYGVAGVITEEDGRPAAGASVGLAIQIGANPAYRTTTASDGTDHLRFWHQGSSPPSAITAFSTQEDSSNLRLLDWTTQQTIVKNLRLRRLRALSAGESMMITIEPDSSLCNWEFGSSVTTLCAWFTVTSATVGTVMVDARPVDAGGVLPRLGWENLGAGATLSLQASVNSRFWLNLAIPVIAAPQRYVVTTRVE